VETADATTGEVTLSSQAPVVSVVVPARDAAATLGHQLRAIAAQQVGVAFEVIVVDDHSSDQTLQLGARHAAGCPNVRVERLDCGAGANAARNFGAGLARGELLVFVDADDQVAPGWLAAMTFAGRSSDLVGGRVEHLRLNDPVVARWRPWNQNDGLPVAVGHLPYVMSCNLAITRHAWERLGGFDADWTGGGTEIELAWRAQAAGLRLAFAPDAVVHYRHRTGLRSMAKQSWRWGRADARLQHRFGLNGAPATALRAPASLAAQVAASPFSPVARGQAVRMASHAAGWTSESVMRRAKGLRRSGDPA
jgi:cellulose synthase/poly-beta-1,6-N-acetylglucosamine synthase-like glycosyltransferase